jgi:hypothetical protein
MPWREKKTELYWRFVLYWKIWHELRDLSGAYLIYLYLVDDWRSAMQRREEDRESTAKLAYKN